MVRVYECLINQNAIDKTVVDTDEYEITDHLKKILADGKMKKIHVLISGILDDNVYLTYIDKTGFKKIDERSSIFCMPDGISFNSVNCVVTKGIFSSIFTMSKDKGIINGVYDGGKYVCDLGSVDKHCFDHVKLGTLSYRLGGMKKDGIKKIIVSAKIDPSREDLAYGSYVCLTCLKIIGKEDEPIDYPKYNIHGVYSKSFLVWFDHIEERIIDRIE